MIFGRGIRPENSFLEEVKFSKDTGFSFMQIWYLEGELSINSKGRNKIELLNETDYPIIIHAVLNVEDIESKTHKILDILKQLSHKQLIIHPVSDKKVITKESIHLLKKALDYASKEFKKYGIELFVENNCRMTKLNYSNDDVELIYSDNEDIKFLLDIAHIDSYIHLDQMIDIKRPQMLHIADKHFSVEHEHLPIGDGELDFELIFSKYLKNYKGKIVLEISASDEEIKESLGKLKLLFNSLRN